MAWPAISRPESTIVKIPGFLRLILRRFAQLSPVIVLATVVVFGLISLVPGDPAITLAGENPTPQRVAEVRTLYGLDKPMIVQYGNWIWRAAHGDLGKSLLSSESVLTLIQQRLPMTLMLVVSGVLLSLLIGVPLGIASAAVLRTRMDGVITAIASLGIAMPGFWLGMILVSVFSLGWRWFPATGAVSPFENFGQSVSHAVLPALALAAGGMAEVTRQVRSAFTEILSSHFVRTLHAKGLASWRIYWQHGLKNIGVPLLTVTGLLFNRLLGATVVIEAVFAIPGLGNLVVQAAINKDFPVIQGVVLLMVVLVTLINLATDLLYAVVDPRVRVA
jgi:peptide/nickel transport system permease protein